MGAPSLSPPHERYDCLFISPHADDVALSCPGRLLWERDRGTRCLVLALFESEGEPSEVAAALREGGIDYLAGGLPSAQRRLAGDAAFDRWPSAGAPKTTTGWPRPRASSPTSGPRIKARHVYAPARSRRAHRPPARPRGRAACVRERGRPQRVPLRGAARGLHPRGRARPPGPPGRAAASRCDRGSRPRGLHALPAELPRGALAAGRSARLVRPPALHGVGGARVADRPEPGTRSARSARACSPSSTTWTRGTGLP